MKVNKQVRKGRLGFLSVIMAFSALLMLGAGCWFRTPAQRAEKAFIKLFEKDYPDWEITKIILAPSKGSDRYEGRFACRARRSMESWDWSPPGVDIPNKNDVYWNGKWYYGSSCTLHRSPPCAGHKGGELLSGHVTVTYAHGDCFYDTPLYVGPYEVAREKKIDNTGWKDWKGK